jgi:hypothetical protein
MEESFLGSEPSADTEHGRMSRSRDNGRLGGGVSFTLIAKHKTPFMLGDSHFTRVSVVWRLLWQ